MRDRNTTLVLSSCLIFFLCFHQSAGLNSKCLSSYADNPERFDACLYKPCFLFRSEIPYIILDEKLNAADDDTPFRCVEYKQRWPDLDGAFFDMIRNMPALNDTICVFAGSQCSFDGMISLVNNSAATMRHQWIAGGVLFVLQNRVLPGAVPSTSILEDTLHIVGPPVEGGETFEEALQLVYKPFSTQAWLIICGVLALFVSVRSLMIYMFGKVIGPLGFLRTLFLFTLTRDRRQRNAREEDWWRILDRHWGIAFIIFLSILILLYEVALAVIAFESAGSPPLLHLKPEEFAVYANTTEEYFFQKLVNSTALHSRFNTLNEIYSVLKYNKTLKYTISYRIDNRYEVTRKPELCSILQLYDTVPVSLSKGRKPPTVTGAWFYSTRIPTEKRAEIDKGILMLKETGRISEFVDQQIGSDEEEGCPANNNRIGGFMLFLLVGCPICYLIAIVVSMCIAACRAKHNNNINDNDDGQSKQSDVETTDFSTSASDRTIIKTYARDMDARDEAKKRGRVELRRITLS